MWLSSIRSEASAAPARREHERRLLARATILGLLFFAACGSEDDPAASGGTGGSGANDASSEGSGGKAGSGGTGGTSSDSGKDADADDASSAGNGTGATAGGPSDGAALDIVQEFVQDPECSGFCARLTSAGCEAGPTDAPQCVVNCNEVRGSVCGPAIEALMTCAGPNPTVTCDAVTKAPVIEGCDAEGAELTGCLADAGP